MKKIKVLIDEKIDFHNRKFIAYVQMVSTNDNQLSLTIKRAKGFGKMNFLKMLDWLVESGIEVEIEK